MKLKLDNTFRFHRDRNADDADATLIFAVGLPQMMVRVKGHLVIPSPWHHLTLGRVKMHAFTSLVVPEDAVGIHWFGQSSYAFKDAAGAVIQIDPYFPRNRPADRFVYSEPPLDEATLPTDTVLLTHNHNDHTNIESIRRIHAAFPACRFVGPPESIANLVENAGVPEALTTTVTAGETVRLESPRVTVHMVWAKPPQGAPADGIQPPDVQHLGFVVEMGGVRVYISGDPIHTFAEHDELIRPIAALHPDIGMLTTHPTEGEFPFFDGSMKMARKIGLKAAVPAHYSCFVKRNYDPQAWAAHFAGDGPQTLIIPYNTAVVYRKAK
jgi:L-ascorbate metabolism protein UlaG (beta-lactamase superfamily)